MHSEGLKRNEKKKISRKAKIFLILFGKFKNFLYLCTQIHKTIF
jgi:hypothetical protein